MSSVNDEGGINGHKVKVISLDDQGNPTIALQDAKELVEQDHAIAVVGVATNAGTSVYPYLQTAGMPVIGTSASDPASDNLFYPVGPTAAVLTSAGLVALGSLGNQKVAFVYCAENAGCNTQYQALKGVASSNGINLSYAASASISAPSYTANCLAAQQSGATAMMALMTAPAVLAIAHDCGQQGYTPQWWVSLSTTNGNVATAPGLEGAITATKTFSWVDNSFAAAQQFHAALQKYAPEVLSSNTYNATTGTMWADLEMFRAAAGKMTGETPTPTAVVTALNSLTNVDLGGLIAPQSYGAGAKAPNCYALSKVSSGKWVALNPNKFACLTS
jgi:branched-chain amino acid transport system substrate-binding protein